jgi:deoxyribose-phosphate aldolase
MTNLQINTIIETVAKALKKSPWQVAEPLDAPESSANLAHFIDHTALKATTNEADIRKLCAEAIQHKFKAVCVNPTWIGLAKDLLAKSEVALCTVIGFPLGANTTTAKLAEAGDAIVDGAKEIDVVQNIAWAKSKNYAQSFEELSTLASIAKPEGVLTKVILETCYLSDEEIVESCAIARLAGFDFVKTSTGFGSAGASAAHIKLMRRVVGNEMGVKASGGIRNKEAALAMINAGASRIGASSSVEIIF